MDTDRLATGNRGSTGTAEVLSGAVPVESTAVGQAIDTTVDAEPKSNIGVEHDVDAAITDEDRQLLRRIPDSIPYISFVLCIVEFAERASYYGAKTVWNNFIQFPLPKGGNGTGAVPKSNPNGHAGALGKGLQFSSAFVILFTFLAYVFPILGAWIADAKLGRFKTIMIGVVIGAVAHVIMVGGAAPAVLVAGNGLAPFLISFFLLAIGAGIFKPNVAPTVIDQYTNQKEYVRTLGSGERVIVDPERTIQRIMLIFYAFVNLGSFFMIATTYTEKYLGFWISFLLPTILYVLIPVLLLVIRKRLIRRAPLGSELTTFFKIVGRALRENKGNIFARDFWRAAAPSTLSARGVNVSWSERAVHDVRRTFEACVIFLYFPLYNINDGGIGAVSSNQGAAMRTDGAPNDLIGNFNPLTIIVATPVLTYGLYPLLARWKVRFGPVRRMTFGFLLAAVSGAIGAIVQWRVYETSPCGYNGASECEEGVSPLSIWWQVPNVALGALSELFCNVTAYEIAYARSPPHLKSVVMAMFLFTQALSAALSEILIPAIIDPHLIWVWAGPAIALVVQTAVFWVRHRHVDDEEYILDQGEDSPEEGTEAKSSV